MLSAVCQPCTINPRSINPLVQTQTSRSSGASPTSACLLPGRWGCPAPHTPRGPASVPLPVCLLQRGPAGDCVSMFMCGPAFHRRPSTAFQGLAGTVALGAAASRCLRGGQRRGERGCCARHTAHSCCPGGRDEGPITPQLQCSSLPCSAMHVPAAPLCPPASPLATCPSPPLGCAGSPPPQRRRLPPIDPCVWPAAVGAPAAALNPQLPPSHPPCLPTPGLLQDTTHPDLQGSLDDNGGYNEWDPTQPMNDTIGHGEQHMGWLPGAALCWPVCGVASRTPASHVAGGLLSGGGVAVLPALPHMHGAWHCCMQAPTLRASSQPPAGTTWMGQGLPGELRSRWWPAASSHPRATV